jgi:O-methyltransferase
MKNGLLRAYLAVVSAISFPALLADFFSPDTGQAYGVGLREKLTLVRRFMRTVRNVRTASSVQEHLVMVSALLRIPPGEEGCVVECGSYKGGSAANLSLVCSLIGRRLVIYDSFAGLPEPGQHDRTHVVPSETALHTYERGEYAGSIQEVTSNIERWGSIDACELRPGFFADTLPLHSDPTVLVFAEACIRALWPHLTESAWFFTHEASHLEIARLFFDRDWWHNEVETEPPGLIGAGSGLGLHPRKGGFRSGLGYARKESATSGYAVRPQIGR